MALTEGYHCGLCWSLQIVIQRGEHKISALLKYIRLWSLWTCCLWRSSMHLVTALKWLCKIKVCTKHLVSVSLYFFKLTIVFVYKHQTSTSQSFFCWSVMFSSTMPHCNYVSRQNWWKLCFSSIYPLQKPVLKTLRLVPAWHHITRETKLILVFPGAVCGATMWPEVDCGYEMLLQVSSASFERHLLQNCCYTIVNY